MLPSYCLSAIPKKLTPEQLALLGLHHGFISESVLLAALRLHLILNQLVKVSAAAAMPAGIAAASFSTIAKEKNTILKTSTVTWQLEKPNGGHEAGREIQSRRVEKPPVSGSAASRQAKVCVSQQSLTFRSM